MNKSHAYVASNSRRQVHVALFATRRPGVSGAAMKFAFALLLAGVLMSGAAFAAGTAGIVN